jgi:hypothetical protein
MLVSNDFCQLGWYMEVCPNCISTIACFHVSLEQCFRGGRGITMATISHHQQHFPSHQSTYINLDIPIPTTIISPTTLQQEMEGNVAAMLEVPSRYMDVNQLLFLIRYLYLIGVWLSEDQKNKNNINTCSKDIGLNSQILSITFTLNSEHNRDNLCI